jgi:hypothetical protein
MGMMDFSAPTSASHPLDSSSGAPQEEDRDAKRRRLVQQQQQVADTAMLETAVATATSNDTCTRVTSNNDSVTMEIDNTLSSSLSSCYYPHPSSSNMFNGNALSDKELVYQVDFLSSCPPSDFVL